MPTPNLYVSVDDEGNIVAVLGSNGEVLERRSYHAAGVASYMLPGGTVVPTSPTGIDIGYRGKPIPRDSVGFQNLAESAFRETNRAKSFHMAGKEACYACRRPPIGLTRDWAC